MAAGQPTKYRPEYCEALFKHMTGGFSFESFAGTILVCRETLYGWEKKHKEFFNAKKRGVAASLLYWEKLGMMGIHGKIKNFNTAVYIFTVKNRLGWVDAFHTENVNHNFKPKSKDELKKKKEENQARLDAIKSRA